MTLFGKELELIRKRAGFTQYKLAKELNMSRSHINRIESGERRANKELLMKIANVMNLESYSINKLLVLSNFDMDIDKTSAGFKICFHLALEFKRKNMLKEAEKTLEFGMFNFENIIELHALQANMNLIKHDYEGAIKQNKETLKLFENLSKDSKKKLGITKAEVIHNLGYVYFEKALEQIYKYEKLLIQNWLEKISDSNEIMNNLKNEILLDLEKATEQIEIALSIEPNNLHILDQLARLYYRKGEFYENELKIEYFTKSIIYYEKLISFNDNDELAKKQEATIFLALALGKLNKIDEAIRLINTVIIFTNIYYLGYYAKSCIYAINSKNNASFLSLSFEALEQAIKLNPDLKEGIKSEIDLYNLHISVEYKSKFEMLCIKRENE